MTPQEILTSITLAVSGWTLMEVIRLGKHFARLDQRFDDLECQKRKECNL